MSQHSSRGAKWEALRIAVLERDHYQCQHCGNELWEGSTDPHHKPEADHIIPKSKGGRDTMDNLIASCKSCNGSRGDALLLRSAFFNPRWLSSL